MSSFRKPFFAVMGLVLLVSMGSIWAQGGSILYNGLDTGFQSRNIPAGTVVDPGTSLLYLADTGINARAAVGPNNLPLYLGPLSQRNQTSAAGAALPENPFGIGGSQAVYDANGNLIPGRVNTTFLSITNTHPTQAVTVHFRYFNDQCLDVLDFLVVLTCNDTLIFNPFDFNIPRTPFNTGARIFGPTQGVLSPIPVSQFGSGRFLIFATAAGTSFELINNVYNAGTHNDNAELRFPNEFDDLVDDEDDCINLRDDTYFGLNPGLRFDNLHVFNASAVAFNYLVGGFSTAVPFGAVFQSWGLNAWTRPAVDLSSQIADSLRNQPDGDGPPLAGPPNDWRILTGQEAVRASNGVAFVQTNFLYLRNDVHAGDTARAPGDPDINDDANFPDYDSWYGALGLISLYGAAPADQLAHFISVVDDYNGSRHSTDPFAVAGFRDRSYNLNGAETTYVLQVYDNDENLFTLVGTPPPNISPLPPQPPPAELNIVVDCLRTWVTTTRQAPFSVDDLQISELSIINATLPAHIDGGPDLNDASRGWIRFVRDHSNNGAPYPAACVPNAAGHQATTGCTRRGTWVGRNTINDSADRASFVTIAYQVVKFSGFGAAFWLPTAASDPRVSEQGVPDPQ